MEKNAILQLMVMIAMLAIFGVGILGFSFIPISTANNLRSSELSNYSRPTIIFTIRVNYRNKIDIAFSITTVLCFQAYYNQVKKFFNELFVMGQKWFKKSLIYDCSGTERENFFNNEKKIENVNEVKNIPMQLIFKEAPIIQNNLTDTTIKNQPIIKIDNLEEKEAITNVNIMEKELFKSSGAAPPPKFNGYNSTRIVALAAGFGYLIDTMWGGSIKLGKSIAIFAVRLFCAFTGVDFDILKNAFDENPMIQNPFDGERRNVRNLVHFGASLANAFGFKNSAAEVLSAIDKKIMNPKLEKPNIMRYVLEVFKAIIEGKSSDEIKEMARDRIYHQFAYVVKGYYPIESIDKPAA